MGESAEDLRRSLAGAYPQGCAAELERAERELALERWDSRAALELGSCIAREAEAFGEGVAIRIERATDHAPVFSYIADTAGERNLGFARGKINTVWRTGHCSLWVMAMEETVGGYGEYFLPESEALPVGGAFPLRVGERIVGVVGVSGLHEGHDHLLLVRSLSRFLQRPEPSFSGVLV